MKKTVIKKRREKMYLEDILNYLEKKFNKEFIIEKIEVSEYEDFDESFELDSYTRYIFKEKDKRKIYSGKTYIYGSGNIFIYSKILDKNTYEEFVDNCVYAKPDNGIYAIVSKSNITNEIIDLNIKDKSIKKELILFELYKEEEFEIYFSEKELNKIMNTLNYDKVICTKIKEVLLKNKEEK